MRQHSPSHAVIHALIAGLVALSVVTAVFFQKALAYDERVFVNVPQEIGETFDLDGSKTSIDVPLQLPPAVVDGTIEDKSSDVPAEEPKRAPLETNAVRPVRDDVPAVVTGAPVRLMIPSIGVSAAIEQVGLTQAGSMDVPKRPENTGWYTLGPRPGERGSAVIAGHLDWYNGIHAVFVDLHKVRAGDSIVVKNDRGETVNFVVRETRKYGASAVATDVFISTDGEAHLNLITCVGTWDSAAGEYSHRLVVFADRQ